VLEADRGKAALSICEAHSEPIHLLLTDIVMPGMSGGELKGRVMEMRPYIKALFMSGYTDDTLLQSGVLDSNTAFLEKPFTPDGLSRKVREVLES
jgi:YesN/AraC family two-component response regulator